MTQPTCEEYRHAFAIIIERGGLEFGFTADGVPWFGYAHGEYGCPISDPTEAKLLATVWAALAE